jgi:ATP-binding protein involved in chromosome partitioning
MEALTDAAVLDALRSVKDPDLHKDIVSLGFVKKLLVAGRRVRFTIELTTPACPVKDLMRDQARAAVASLGASDIEIEMTSQVRAAPSTESKKAPVEGVKNIIAVGAGKGGVGKTTIAVNLAVALASRGGRVGLLDADIHGPNVPIMLGLTGARLETDGKKIVPAERYGLQTVSVGFMADEDTPVIWRGPMLHSIVTNFFRDVRWNDLDYLIVDMPPGTGDVVLSLAQYIPVTGAVVVTTPQTVSLADTRRAAEAFRKLHVPVIGLVENMSHFVCPSCGHESDVFGRGGGERLATDLAVPFLGRVPLYEPIRSGGDQGIPIVVSAPDSAPARALMSAAERVAQQVSVASFAERTIRLVPAPGV